MKLYRLYILDLDGTIYRGEEPLPNAVETVTELKRRGAIIRYLTNNSGQTQEFYAAKLQRMGFEVTPQEVFSSALGAAKVCLDRGYQRVFFVGEPGLRETLSGAGLTVVNSGEEFGEAAEAVVAGICRSYSYRWMNSALQQILGGAEFIATNGDPTYPVENGAVQPGAGSIVASIQTCSGKTPQVIGKPNPLLLQMILRETGATPNEALAVGDRYDTDILSGQNAGCDTHLVLTGVTRTPPPGQSFSEDLSGLLPDA